MSAPRRHALRRLDPFLGVTQVVEGAAGRALSVDGVNWEIQLRATLPAGWGVLNRGRGENVFFRFGVWSREEGLARFPPARNVDPNAAERDTAALLAQVEEALPALPFPLADTLECWLLDADRKPLALLASLPPDAPRRRAQHSKSRPPAVRKRWRIFSGSIPKSATRRGSTPCACRRASSKPPEHRPRCSSRQGA